MVEEAYCDGSPLNLSGFRRVLPCRCEGAVREREASERASAEREAAERAREEGRRVAATGIPARYRDVEPDFGMLGRVRSGRGLYVYGDAGVRKTTLACAVLKAWAISHDPCTALFVTAPDMLTEIKATFSRVGPSEAEVVDRYGSCALLVLDDLGKGVPTRWAVETMWQIVNRRSNGLLPTVVTTQFRQGELISLLSGEGSERTAKALVSRLHESCDLVEMTGPDMRLRGGGQAPLRIGPRGPAEGGPA